MSVLVACITVDTKMRQIGNGKRFVSFQKSSTSIFPCFILLWNARPHIVSLQELIDGIYGQEKGRHITSARIFHIIFCIRRRLAPLDINIERVRGKGFRIPMERVQ
ncbi:hypothetical protein [Liberibacter crescens]|uniref:hypothetical protein n=1 Tax=Liberibacter crescens TaxID=1273132 RepID=UPI0005A03726|nr:hypothetical protein [Liberibacter crescens]AMC12646.1 hypothetical protein RL73_02545 [Liberibacter crescens]